MNVIVKEDAIGSVTFNSAAATATFPTGGRMGTTQCVSIVGARSQFFRAHGISGGKAHSITSGVKWNSNEQ
jgi:hypothetical protein